MRGNPAAIDAGGSFPEVELRHLAERRRDQALNWM